MAGVTTVLIKKEDDGMRLNRWFLREYPALSLGRLQKLLRTKQIKVDGKRAEANTRLAAGQELRLPPLDREKAAPKERSLSKEDFSFAQSLVIYKDANILVLNKPSGLAVQGGSGISRHLDGMLDALMFELSERPRLVHRIDKDTSGVLVLARNRNYAEILTKAFREHQMGKKYALLCYHCPPKMQDIIRAPLEKMGERMRVSEQGKKAETAYRVIDSLGEKFALVEAEPLTGRTHQIRAHFEYIGCPLVGDTKYDGNEHPQASDLSRKLHLHAFEIDLSAVSSKKTVVKAPLPDYFIEDATALGLNMKEFA